MFACIVSESVLESATFHPQFGPNELAMEAMILKAGFSRVVRGERWAENIVKGQQAPAIGALRPSTGVISGRTVFYAYA